MISILIDVVLLAALVAALFFGLRLSRQFSEIKADQARLGPLVDALNNAAARAENAVKSMRQTALEGAEDLNDQISKGRGLFDELEIMIEAGDNLAERLQVIAQSSRQTVQSSSVTAKKSQKKVAPIKQSKETSKSTATAKSKASRAEEELKDALLKNKKKT